MEAKNIQHISLEAFLKLEKEENYKYELIDGQVYMQARPNYKHQSIQAALIAQLYNFLKNKSCRVIGEAELRIENNIVIPDILIYCDNKFDGQTYEGIPLVIIEILSDSTRFRDYNQKMALYRKHGVSEYWIVNPKVNSITLYDFKKSESLEFSLSDKFNSNFLNDFILDTEELFS